MRADPNQSAHRGMRAVVVGMWPSAEAPERGIFVKRQVDALRRLGHTIEVAELTDLTTGIGSIAKYVELASRARSLGDDLKPDLLHGHYLAPTGRSTRRAAQKLGVPYVMTAHGTDVANAERSGLWRRLTTPVIDDAELVIAVSEDLAARIHDLWPDTKVVVSHMGVDTGRFHPIMDVEQRDAAARTAGWGHGNKLVSVGALTANKNHASLIRAFARLDAGATMTIIGDGPLRGELDSLVHQLGVTGRVRFLGRLEPHAMRTQLQTADVAALVSHREGYGVAGLEALACGVPLVVSGAAPVSDLVDDGTTGAIINPDQVDSIERGLRKALEIGTPCAAAESRAREHDVVSQATRVIAAWYQATGRQPDVLAG